MKTLSITIRAFVLLWIALCVCVVVKAQGTLERVAGWNAYVHLPSDYDQTSKKYPTILFFPGLGEVGNDPNKLIANGPSAYLMQGWDGSALGVQFIVISLQPPSAWPRPWTVKEKIDLLKAQYRIGDYYMTGLSMGGWTALWYSYYYPNEIKKLVGVESVVPTDYGISIDYKAPALAGQHYLLFEQQNDYRKNDSVVYWMNQYSPGSSFYQYTTFGGGGHCCWNEFYGGGGKQPGVFNINGRQQTLYEWIAEGTQDVLATFITKAYIRGSYLFWDCESTEQGDYFQVLEERGGKWNVVSEVPASGTRYRHQLLN